MPKYLISTEQIAVMQILVSLDWSQRRIAEVFRIDQSTVHYALRRRKSRMPEVDTEPRAIVVAKVVDRIDRVTRRAAAIELRKIAAEFEATP